MVSIFASYSQNIPEIEDKETIKQEKESNSFDDLDEGPQFIVFDSKGVPLLSDNATHFSSFYDTGEKKTEETFKKGVRDGISKQYYKSGKTETEYLFLNGTLLNVTSYYGTGEIKFVMNYKNGKPDGDSKQYYTSGKTKIERLFEKGKLISDAAYYESGIKRIEYLLKDGKRDGVAQQYDTNGKLERKLLFDDGVLQNITTLYNTGEVNRVDNYTNKERNGVTKQYYKNGKLKCDWFYENGKLINAIGYFENGNKKNVFNYKNGKRDGVSQQYYQSGKLETEYFYTNGKIFKTIGYYETGEKRVESNNEINGKHFNKKGILESEIFLEDGNKQIHKIYYEDGKVNYVYNLQDRKRDGLSYKYFKNGKTECEFFYKNGELMRSINYTLRNDMKIEKIYENNKVIKQTFISEKRQ